jgi:hypothetical protein
MNTDFIIAAIDADIQQLRSAGEVLIQAVKDSPVFTSNPTKRRKRSKAARARIAEAAA